MTQLSILNVPTVQQTTLAQQKAWASLHSYGLTTCGLTKCGFPGFGILNRCADSNGSAASGTSATIVISPEVQLGDIIVLQVSCAGASIGVTPPAGWTTQKTINGVGAAANCTTVVYTKVATSAEVMAGGGTAGQTLTFTLGSSEAWTIVYAAYYSAAASSTINTSSSAVSAANGTTITPAAATTTAVDCVIVQLYAGACASAQTCTPGAGLIQAKVAGTGTSLGVSAAISSAHQSAAGGTGTTPTATLSVTGGWTSVTICIAPAMSFSKSSSSTANTGGTLADSTTFFYRVAALNNVGGKQVGTSLPCPEFSQATGTSAGNLNTVTISWAQQAGATAYAIYGRSTGAELLMFTTADGTVTSFTDTGAITPSGALPTTDTSVDVFTAAKNSSTMGAMVVSGGTSTIFDTEIFQLTDSLQATNPCYIVLGYASSSAAAADPTIQFTFGAATSAAGAISAAGDSRWPNSASTTVQNCPSSANAVVGTENWYFNSDGSSLLVAWIQPGTVASGGAFCLERLRDYDGTPSGNGVWACGPPTATIIAKQQGYYTTAGVQSGYLGTPTSGGYQRNVPSMLRGWDLPVKSALINGVLYVFPISTGMGWPGDGGASKYLIAYWSADLPPFNVITLASFYGGSHNFLALGANQTSWDAGADAGMAIAVRVD